MNICKGKIYRKSCNRFYLLPKWLNCITWDPGDPMIYRWGYWHFSFDTKKTTKYAKPFYYTDL